MVEFEQTKNLLTGHTETLS